MRNTDVVVATALLLTVWAPGILAGSRLRGTEQAIVVTTAGSNFSGAEMPQRENRRLRTSNVSSDAVVFSNLDNTRNEAELDGDQDQTDEAAINFVPWEHADSLILSPPNELEVSAMIAAQNSIGNATEFTPSLASADPGVLATFHSASRTARPSGFDGESTGGQPIALKEVVSRSNTSVNQARQAQKFDALPGVMDSRRSPFGLHGQPLHLENHRFFGEMVPRTNYMPPFQVPRASRRQLQRYAEL